MTGRRRQQQRGMLRSGMRRCVGDLSAREHAGGQLRHARFQFSNVLVVREFRDHQDDEVLASPMVSRLNRRGLDNVVGMHFQLRQFFTVFVRWDDLDQQLGRIGARSSCA
jgi:hypothetical protein